MISNAPENQDLRYIRLNMAELNQLNVKDILAQNFESKTKGKHDDKKLASLIMGAYSSKWRSDS